jgi:hypothetical protein
MQTLDVVRIAATIAAFAASASKLLPSTLGFWESFSPPVSRWLPGVVLVLGALPAALTGVTTWEQFVVAALGAVAMAMPGTHKNLAAPLPEPKRNDTIKPPPPGPPSGLGGGGMAAAFALSLLLLSCGGSQPDPRALIDLTPLVCRSVLAAQRLQPAEVERICADSRIGAQLGADIAEAVSKAALAAQPAVDVGGGPSAGGGAPNVAEH